MTDQHADLYWNGEKVGTVPPDFDPLAIKSKSFFYDPRLGDFTRDGDKWIAHHLLGPGDLEAVPDFKWMRAADQPAPDPMEEAFSAIGFALINKGQS